MYFSASRHKQIRDMVEQQALDGRLMYIRRRDFEVEAVTREVLRRVHASLVRAAVAVGKSPLSVWQLPVEPTDPAATMFIDRAVLHLVHDPVHGAGIAAELRASLSARDVQLVTDPTAATHTVVVLTAGVLVSQEETVLALAQAKNGRFVFVYSEDNGWNFRCAERRKHAAIDAALNNNEAMTYRPACDPWCEHSTGYEHTAMLTEMLTRLSKIK